MATVGGDVPVGRSDSAESVSVLVPDFSTGRSCVRKCPKDSAKYLPTGERRFRRERTRHWASNYDGDSRRGLSEFEAVEVVGGVDGVVEVCCMCLR